nr:hypothetical protein BaRGS_025451 [Batillaria attramentaria]
MIDGLQERIVAETEALTVGETEEQPAVGGTTEPGAEMMVQDVMMVLEEEVTGMKNQGVPEDNPATEMTGLECHLETEMMQLGVHPENGEVSCFE